MDFIEKLKLIERIDSLISRKSTGTPAHLSQRVGVSERTLYNIIAIMKNLGAPIFYCNARTSYCYTASVSFSYAYNVVEEEEDIQSDDEKNLKEHEGSQIDSEDAKKEEIDFVENHELTPYPPNNNIRKLTPTNKPSQDITPDKSNEWVSQKESRNLFFPRRTF